ncbi:MAG: polysaccharide deacetylase family protein [Phycisphaerae bacterium]
MSNGRRQQLATSPVAHSGRPWLAGRESNPFGRLFNADDWSARLIARVNRGVIRILSYHGVCRDADRAAPWVPSHYVTTSALDDQLGLLRRAGAIVELGELAALLRSGRVWREPLFVVTFDDAPANLLTLAQPILDAHGVCATIFAVTDRLNDGDALPADKRQALFGRTRRGTAAPADASRIDPDVRERIRHMRRDEARALISAGHQLGAHTCTHVRLSYANPACRRREIVESVHAVRTALDTDDVAFAYPYGQSTDFGSQDVATLRACGVSIACTGIPGRNLPECEPLLLHRNCIGLYHDRAAFVAEMLSLRGYRSVRAVLGARRRAAMFASTIARARRFDATYRPLRVKRAEEQASCR